MRCFIALFGLLLFSFVKTAAQTKITVPFYTAYRTTYDARVLDMGTSIRKDVVLLSDTSTRVRFYIHNSKTGELNIALNALSVKTAKQLTLEIKGKKMNVSIPYIQPLSK